jgi:hypothetical protein
MENTVTVGGLTVLSVGYQTYQQLIFLGVNISELPYA